MLIVTRKRGEKLIFSATAGVIPDKVEVEITVLQIGQNRVRFGITAPKEVAIHKPAAVGSELSDDGPKQ